MIDIAGSIFLLALALVPLSWWLPRSVAMDGVALYTLLVIGMFSPFAAGWLLFTSLAIPPILRLGDRIGQRGAIAAIWAIILLAGFTVSRAVSGPVWVGVAFFTLRHLHVVGDWWMRQLAVPTIRAYLRYQFFLPVMVIGPIGRIQTFDRQLLRRRWELSAFLEGAERVLLGAFMAIVLGGWIFSRSGQVIDGWLISAHPFLRDWAASATYWVVLYFDFAGLTAVALGLALMMGLRLEENFDHPWRARTLLDFWTRWHITLARWVMDYVFRPVMALSRNAFIGLVAAMLAIGLWHEFSLYYVIWACWQVLGIMLTRLALKHIPAQVFPPLLRQVTPPLIVLVWLSLSRPIAERVLALIW